MKQVVQNRIKSEELLAKIHFADTLLSEKNYEDAKNVYKEVLEKIIDRKDLQYDYTELCRKIGDCYYSLKDTISAGEYYKNCLKYYQNNKSIYQVLGRIYAERDAENATNYYLSALKLGADESYFTNITWLMMNNSKYKQKDIKETFEYWVDRFRPKYLEVMPPFTHGNDRKIKDKKLNIAYVSTDFYCHAMMSFILPIIENHNQEKYNFTLYMLNNKWDAVTDRIKDTGMKFVELGDASPQDIAKRIYEDKIDIVVDLAGWVNTKTFWMLYKPAPVQMQYLGFLQTYGIREVDYVIVDKYSIPENMAKYYVEKPLYLRGEMQKYCFSHPKTNVPPCNPEPICKKNGYITFGCFNNIGKIDDYSIKLWTRLLEEIPEARLLIYRTQLNEAHRFRIENMFKAHNADMERVIFKNDSMSPHFLIYEQADIALDPVPFSGLTVTIETLMMGTPVLCLKNETLQSKGTARVELSLGMDELVAEDEDDFINKAKALANPDVITKYREELRYKVISSDLFSDYNLAADFEDAFDRAWQAYCR